MNTILMCGYENGSETLNMLFAAIRSIHYSAFHISDETFSVIPPKAKEAQYIIIDNKAIKNIHAKNGIALFRKQVDAKNEIEIPPSFFAVIDSDNTQAADMLKKNGIQTVTCGLSQKDTVTFSSLENERAVVSLQRGLTALDGSELLPVEVPIAFSASHSEYPILASVAVLLLSGAVIPGEGLNIVQQN